MLILTRRVGEGVVIGAHITITVLGVKGNQARLGVSAPDNVPVNRTEVSERIRLEQASANSGCDASTEALAEQTPR